MVGRENRQARAVGGDQRIGAEFLAMRRAELAQARRADFLTHLDDVFGVEAELATLLQHGAKGRRC